MISSARYFSWTVRSRRCASVWTALLVSIPLGVIAVFLMALVVKAQRR